MGQMIIEKVTKYHGDTLFLDDIWLTIKAPKIVCLIGASGPRFINRLVDDDHGECHL